MIRILLISLISFSVLSIPQWKLINTKKGAYIQNNTSAMIYCYIGMYEFSVKPKSRSRNYPKNKKYNCK